MFSNNLIGDVIYFLFFDLVRVDLNPYINDFLILIIFIRFLVSVFLTICFVLATFLFYVIYVLIFTFCRFLIVLVVALRFVICLLVFAIFNFLIISILDLLVLFSFTSAQESSKSYERASSFIFLPLSFPLFLTINVSPYFYL